jgi:hypothetical protein
VSGDLVDRTPFRITLRQGGDGQVAQYDGGFLISSLMLKDPDGIQIELTAPHS